MHETGEALTKQLNVALSERVMSRLRRIYRQTGVKPTQYARAAIEQRLARSYLVELTPEELGVLAEFKAIGGDLVPILRAAIPTLAAPATSAPSA
jgi:hypothetical protein